MRRAREIAKATAQTFRATADFAVTSSVPTLVNDARLSDLALRMLTALLGSDRALRSDAMSGEGRKSTGSEDFAFVSHAVPSLMVALAAGRPQDGHAHPAHHPMTTFDEAALPTGAAVYAALALAALE